MFGIETTEVDFDLVHGGISLAPLLDFPPDTRGKIKATPLLFLPSIEGGKYELSSGDA